jgi:DNA-binding CsgD family transcriptional regulator
MRRLLFSYMLVLVLAVSVALTLTERFGTAEQNTYEKLELQMDFFEREVDAHFRRLTAAGERMAGDLAGLLDERYGGEQAVTRLTGGPEPDDLQEDVTATLRQYLLQGDCSGAFVLMESALLGADIYLRLEGGEAELYCGPAGAGESCGVTPDAHWRADRTAGFILDDVVQTALPPARTCALSRARPVPGTGEQAMFITVPVVSAEGFLYGFCGWELSAPFFRETYAQTAGLEHLACLLAPEDGDVLNAAAGLSCGACPADLDRLTFGPAAGGARALRGNGGAYIGVTRPAALAPGGADYVLAVMVPQAEHDEASRQVFRQKAALWGLLLLFTVGCCAFFSRRFLTPVLRGLERLRDCRRPEEPGAVPELDDLADCLDRRDRAYEEELRRLTRENQAVRRACASAEAEAARLAYSRKQEIDPADYQRFLEGLTELTPAEKRIFGYYLDGRSVREVMELASIKESTLRYHNQNIYGKLGVNSLKQMLRYAALMKQEKAQ